MNTNTDKLGQSGDTNTARIPRPALKPVPKVAPPTIPVTAPKTQAPTPSVNPLKSVTKKEKSTDTVSLKVVKDAKPTPVVTQTVKLRPPNAAPAGQMTPPKPVTTSTESISKSEVVAAAEKTQKMQAAETVATKTVKLKSPIKPGNMTATKTKVASPQDKTVKMKSIPDAATGAEKTSTKVTPPMPYEDELEEPGVLMTILSIASVAAVSVGLYFTFQSMTVLEMF